MSEHRIIEGDCRDAMATLDAESVDAIVTDPPYGLSFMGKGWDHGVPGVEFWTEAMRVAKPGAHLLAFGGTRTYHRLACAIEDAGWEIRDCVMWVYGSGFPKSHNLKGEWQGWGTALKPAWEPIIVARKPLCGTVAENVLKHETGGINVDGCRVGMRTENESGWSKTGSKASQNRSMSGANYDRDAKNEAGTGRWPANVIHDGSDEAVAGFPDRGKAGTAVNRNRGDRKPSAVPYVPKNANGPDVSYGDSGSAARFFYCAKASKADRDEGCEGLAAIHRANGNKWTDQDYRVTSGERPSSAESGPRRNHHPTVKPAALMRYLCRLVTPPGGIVLDPFTGSGSTGKGAVLEGFRFIGIEREAEYVEIARARIAAVADSGCAAQVDEEPRGDPRPASRPSAVWQQPLFEWQASA